MPNTPTYALPYPSGTDGPAGPSQIGALASAVESAFGRGARILATGSTSTDTVVTSTSLTTLVSAAFTMPSNAVAGQRVVAIGQLIASVGTVGNVAGGIGLTDNNTGTIATGSWSTFALGGLPTARLPNPTAGGSYATTFVAFALATSVTAGGHTMTLRVNNIAAGTMTSNNASLIVALI